MDTKYSIKHTDDALTDIYKIHQYLSEEFNAPHIADRTVRKIFDKIDSLTIMPERGAMYYSNSALQMRSVKAGRYLIIYKLYKKDHVIEIYAVVHARRNLAKLLKSLDE